MKYTKFYFIVFLNAIVCQPACAANLQVGSYEQVSVESAVGPISGGNNSLIGFALFSGGFSLTDSATSVVWDCYYPIQGTTTLNNGTMTLTEDFLMASDATFSNGGTVEGAYKIVFPTINNTFSLPGAFVFNNSTVVCNSPVTLTGLSTFQGSCVIEGNTNVIDLSSGSIIIDSDSTLYIKNAIIDGISSAKITCQSSTSTLNLDDTIVIQDGSYSFTAGNLEVVNTNLITGKQIFSFETTGTCLIHENSTLAFDSGMTFSYNAASRNALVFENRLAVLRFYETTIYSNTPGFQLTTGTVVVEGTCPVYNGATMQSNGILIGNGSFADNVTLRLLSESGFDVKAGYLVYDNV